MNLRILPPEEMIDAIVSVPISKSICNRLLVINALTPNAQPVDPVADCDDSRVLAQVLQALQNGETEVNTGNAGTATRFASAFIAANSSLGDKEITLECSERMRQRPIGPLVEALRSLGAKIEYLEEDGFPPLRITPQQLVGGEIEIDATISSQFISALMMVAPTMTNGLTIRLVGEAASRPYINMTAQLICRAGIDAEFERYTITIPHGTYQPADQTIEADWSAASYWYELAAIAAGFITIRDLQLPSLQGDSRCAEFFEMLGVTTSEPDDDDFDEPVNGLAISPSPEQFSRFEVDLSENPDLAQTFAVTCAMLGIPFHLRGLSTLRIKETDRLEAMRSQLDKFGLIVEIRNNSELVWNGERHPIFTIPVIETFGDHRMAMAFAPTAIFVPGIIILNAEVVEKSYPDYWQQLQNVGFQLDEVVLSDIAADTEIDPAALNPNQDNEPARNSAFPIG